MRFRVERSELADAVAWTARAVPAKSSLPVLMGLLLEATATDGRLRMSGFDYETSAQGQITVEVGEEGRALVPGRLLADICRSLPDQPVDVSTDGSRVRLRCGAARFELPTLPLEEYPTLPELPAVAGSLESDVFANAVAQVAVAADRGETLPTLSGVRVEIDGESLTLVATDRYRLAVRELSWRPQRPGLAATALVPARTLADTAKSLTGGAEVTLSLSTAGSTAGPTGSSTGGPGEGLIGFAGGSRRTTSRLIDGEFPKYRNLLPSESPSVALLPTARFIEAVKRVSLVATRNRTTPVVLLSFIGGEAVLSAGAGDEASASESLEATYQGDDLTTAFNPGYLLDGLTALDSDVTRMGFTVAGKPAIITGKDAEAGGDYRYLLMPVRSG